MRERSGSTGPARCPLTPALEFQWRKQLTPPGEESRQVGRRHEAVQLPRNVGTRWLELDLGGTVVD